MVANKRQFYLAGIGALILIALGVRILHERRVPAASSGGSDVEIERRAREHPNDLAAQLDWGAALAKLGRNSDAEAVFAHAAQISPQSAQPYTWLGILAVQDHRPDYARVNFQQSIKCDPTNAEVWSALGELYSQARARSRAIDAYEHAVRLRADNEIAWRQLGVLESKANLLARGHDALQHAVALKPDDMEAQIDLGNNALIQGFLPEAKQAFEQALAHRSDDPAALLGSAEASIQLDPSPESLFRAEKQVNQALALQPTAHARLVRGRIYLLQRGYRRAVDELNAAYSLDPQEISALAYLSQAYSGMSRPDLARKASSDFQIADAKAHHKANH